MSNEHHVPASSSCCSHSAPAGVSAADEGAGSPTARATLLGPSNDELTTCPVMVGSTVVKAVAEAAGLYRDYQGARYWFCCAGCGPAFDANPERYVSAA